jgi:pyrimidine deaminase RibD-like protein
MNEDVERKLLGLTVDLSKQCTPSATSFSVGCVVADFDGKILATGYSREFGDTWHAEAVALEKLKRIEHPRDKLVLFSSMEPCSVRKSGRRSCCAEIIDSGIRRVVFGIREPRTFVTCEGVQVLRDKGIVVVQRDDSAQEIRRINGHLLND